jgi:uncharacterized protein (TIGR03067 family)
MKFVETDQWRALRNLRLNVVAGLALLVPEASLTLQSRSLAEDAAGQSPSPAAAQVQADQEKMQGNWRIVHCEFSGRDERASPGNEDTISGDKWIRPKRRTAEYQLKFDPTKDPKWVDLSSARLGDQALKGIYLLDGDTLTICYAYDPELARPTEFKTTPGVRAYMYVLKRVKKE